MARRDSTQATPPCHIRRIKTGRIMYDYRRKTHYPPQATVPWLQLKGHWLEQAGFNIDSPVTIRVMQGCLVLTAE
jgi:toxic protein SymE